jgi:hypothetical protein
VRWTWHLAAPGQEPVAGGTDIVLLTEDGRINQVIGFQSLDGDLPSKDWLKDWESIAALRDRAAADLEAGRKPSFGLPKIDGHPITYRMDHASSCTVPTELTTLS